MPGIEFDVIITREALDYARVDASNVLTGWHLTPKRFEVSAVASSDFSDTRDLNSRNEIWCTRAFSAVYPQESNKILMNLTIPPNAHNSVIAIQEIYFIFENYDNEKGTEFLFALARPTSTLDFTPGVSQSFKFVFALNNLDNIESIVDISYSYPEEISDHNIDLDAHDYLLRRDGSRTANGVLRYNNTKTFTTDLDLVTKGFVNSGLSSHNTDQDAHDYLLRRDGTRSVTGVLQYDSAKTFTSDLSLISKGYVDTNLGSLRNDMNNMRTDLVNQLSIPIVYGD